MHSILVGLLHFDTQAHADWEIDARKQFFSTALASFDGAVSAIMAPGTRPLRAIFLAPEYMFAAPTLASNGAHLAGRRQVEKDVRQELQRLFEQLSTRHAGILIVPGTVSWRKPMPQDIGEWTDKVAKYGRILRKAGKYTWNLPAGSLADHPVSDPTKTYLHIPTPQEKINALGSYVARNTAYCYLDGKCLYSYHKIGDFHEVLNWGVGNKDTVNLPNKRPGRFEAGGIQFGISICYDQSLYRIDETPAGYNHCEMQMTTNEVDMHILLSACIPPDLQLANLKQGNAYLLSCSSHAAFNGVMRKGGTKVNTHRVGDVESCLIMVGGAVPPVAPGVAAAAVAPAAPAAVPFVPSQQDMNVFQAIP